MNPNDAKVPLKFPESAKKQVLEGEDERELWGIPCVATGSTLITPSFILDQSAITD